MLPRCRTDGTCFLTHSLDFSAATACIGCTVYSSMVGFNISLAKLDVSVAYAVWGAIGTVLVTAVGFLFFGETLDMVKILCLTLIVVGVAGLNLRG